MEDSVRGVSTEKERFNAGRRKSLRLQNIKRSFNTSENNVNDHCNIFSSTIISNIDSERNLRVLVPETPNRSELSSIHLLHNFKGATTVMETPDDLLLNSNQVSCCKTLKNKVYQANSTTKMSENASKKNSSNVKDKKRMDSLTDSSDDDSNEFIENFNFKKCRNAQTLLELECMVSSPKLKIFPRNSVNKRKSVIGPIEGKMRNGVTPRNLSHIQSTSSKETFAFSRNVLGVNSLNNSPAKAAINTGSEDMFSESFDTAGATVVRRAFPNLMEKQGSGKGELIDNTIFSLYCYSFSNVLINLFISCLRSFWSIGRYPLKAKFCPFIPAYTCNPKTSQERS